VPLHARSSEENYQLLLPVQRAWFNDPLNGRPLYATTPKLQDHIQGEPGCFLPREPVSDFGGRIQRWSGLSGAISDLVGGILFFRDCGLALVDAIGRGRLSGDVVIRLPGGTASSWHAALICDSVRRRPFQVRPGREVWRTLKYKLTYNLFYGFPSCTLDQQQEYAAHLEVEYRRLRRELGPEPPQSAPTPRLIEFIPTAFQERVLNALDKKALTKRALERVLGVDSKQLQRDGLTPLMRAGKIRNNRNAGGYYRPDAPPPRLLQNP
jgi:hypothetical protein